MKPVTYRQVSCLLVFAFLICFAEPVSAHGEEPRLEITPEVFAPGSTLDIRGVGFEFEEQIVLMLAGSSVGLSLGTIIADAEGGFLLSISLPPDLAEGTYFIQATIDDHEVTSVPFSVQGAAALGEGGEGMRDEDDGLLAPMPTLPPGFTSTPIPKTGSPMKDLLDTKNRFLIPGFVMGASLLAWLGFRLCPKY